MVIGRELYHGDFMIRWICLWYERRVGIMNCIRMFMISTPLPRLILLILLYKDVHDFNSFLEDQVAKGFPSLKNAESFVAVHKHVLDKETNEPIRAVMWLATAQVKHIPVPQNCPDGSLHSMLYWVHDETSDVAVIKLKEDCIRLYDKRDILQFGERDIHQLAKQQIIVADELFEPAAKEYTRMVATIIEKRIWNGAMGRSDVLVVDKD